MFGKKTSAQALTWQACAVAILLTTGSSAHGDSVGDIEGIRNLIQHQHAAPAGSNAGNGEEQAENLVRIGGHDFGGIGFHADVWAHDDHAYVGSWGVFGFACPSDGTKIVDISDPADPVWIGSLPAPANTQTNDVKVAEMDNRYFDGTIAVLSNEDCAGTGARGVALWDVSEPGAPQALGRFGPEVTDPFSLEQIFDFGFGVHNTSVFKVGDRTYAALVVDFAELLQLIFTGASFSGDLRILDITDPNNPVQVSDWGIIKDLGLDPFAEGQGDDFALGFLHDVWVHQKIAYLSYWDAGLVLVDVSDPSNPKFVSRIKYGPDKEGNTHVAIPARGGNIVITGDEDFTPGPWGGLHIFDTSDPFAPFEIATFSTVNSDSSSAPGWYTAHNLAVRGNKLYVSWYADGIRVLKISQPSQPVEIASYVPAATADPYGFVPTGAQMWGIYLHDELILGSDINGGLHILCAEEDCDDGQDDQ